MKHLNPVTVAKAEEEEPSLNEILDRIFGFVLDLVSSPHSLSQLQ